MNMEKIIDKTRWVANPSILIKSGVSKLIRIAKLVLFPIYIP